MLLLILGVAAQASVDAGNDFKSVVPIDPAKWIGPELAAPRAAAMEQKGIVAADVFVDDTGKPQICRLVNSVSADLDRTTCAVAVFRGRYRPAIDANGKPMPGVYRFRVNWVLDPNSLHLKVPDITLTVATVPNNKMLFTQLKFIVDEDGRVERCAVEQTSGYAKFDAAGCLALQNRYSFDPATDKTGKRWRTVRSLLIGFEPSKTQVGR